MTSERKYHLTVIAFMVLAFGLRLYYVIQGKPLEDQIWSDMREYVVKAEMIMKGEWNAMHFFQSIGYSLIIAGFKSSFTNWGKVLSYFQAMISFLTVWIIFKTSVAAFGRKVGLIALFLVSIHLPWIVFINLALPETIFTFLLSILAWMSYQLVISERPSILYAAGWGIAFVFAFWLKGTHVFLLPLFLLGLLALKKVNAIPACSMIGLIFTIGIAAHGALAYKKVGKFQLSSSTGGLNFIEGKCPIKGNRDSVGYSFMSPVYFQMGLTAEKKWSRPFTDSSYFMKQGFKCIQENPGVLIQSLEGIPFLFMGNTLWPMNQMPFSNEARLYEQVFAILVICGLALFAVGLPRDKDRWNEIVIWGLPVLSVFLCVYIFKSEVRYRLPFDVWLIPMAVYGWIKSPAFAGLRKLEEIDVSADSNVSSIQTNVAWNELNVRIKENITSKRDTYPN